MTRPQSSDPFQTIEDPHLLQERGEEMMLDAIRPRMSLLSDSPTSYTHTSPSLLWMTLTRMA